MIYYQYGKRAESMDCDGAYFMGDDMNFATGLLNKGLFSTEVNVINGLRDLFNGSVSNKTFIDIGANVGTYTVVLGKIFGHTYAFEPDRHNYNILCGNIALHSLSDKCDAFKCALSDSHELVSFKRLDSLGGNNMCVKDGNDISGDLYGMYSMYESGVMTDRIATRTLDSFGIDNVGLVKIDVEGFELNVIKGASETLSRSGWPTILVESWNVNTGDSTAVIEAKKKLRKDLFSHLSLLGYDIKHVDNDIFVAVKN